MNLIFLALTLTFSFSALAFNPTVTLEYNVHPGHKATDILFVIDNSGSMSSHQDTLKEFSRDFLKPMTGIDYKIAAISTDKLNIISPFFIEPHVSNPVQKLEELMIHFGDLGDSSEYVYANINSFLNSDQGKLFFRKNNLEVIILTDENEQSHISSQNLLNMFKNKNVTFNAVIPVGSCANFEHLEKIKEIVQLSTGEIVDLCLDKIDFSNEYSALARAILKRAETQDHVSVPFSFLQLQHEFILDSVKIYYGNQIIPKGSVHNGWIYDGMKNQILFGSKINLSKQPEGTKFTIQYDVK